MTSFCRPSRLALILTCVQVHLSHNRITHVGAEAVLKCIPTPPLTAVVPGRFAKSRASPQQGQIDAGQQPTSRHGAGSLGSTGSTGPPGEAGNIGTPSKPSPPSPALDSLSDPAIDPAGSATPTLSATEQFTRLLSGSRASLKNRSGSTISDGTSSDPQSTSVGQLEKPDQSTAVSPSGAAALEDTASSPDPTKQAPQSDLMPLSPSNSEDARQLNGAHMARKPLWLRLEWNQIGLVEFMQVMSCQQ